MYQHKIKTQTACLKIFFIQTVGENPSIPSNNPSMNIFQVGQHFYTTVQLASRISVNKLASDLVSKHY
jgi:hypothetical protein